MKVEEHSETSVETARLNVDTRERTVQRRKLVTMVADLEVKAMENIAITARPRAMTRMGAGSAILNEHHSGTRA